MTKTENQTTELDGAVCGRLEPLVRLTMMRILILSAALACFLLAVLAFSDGLIDYAGGLLSGAIAWALLLVERCHE
jgi:hypothetical protein